MDQTEDRLRTLGLALPPAKLDLMAIIFGAAVQLDMVLRLD